MNNNGDQPTDQVRSMYSDAKRKIQRLEDTPRTKGEIRPYDHVKNGLMTAATTYIQLVEGGMDPLDRELKALRNTARKDLSVLSLYFNLLVSDSNFAQAEMFTRLGFFPELYLNTNNTKLYVAKVKRGMKKAKLEVLRK